MKTIKDFYTICDAGKRLVVESDLKIEVFNTRIVICCNVTLSANIVSGFSSTSPLTVEEKRISTSVMILN